MYDGQLDSDDIDAIEQLLRDGVPVLNGEQASVTDTATDPSSNGEFRRNGTDLKAYSGGAVKNLSDIGTGGGGPYGTVLVAASDAKSTSGADFVCDGTDDHTTINNAIAALPSVGGTVVFTEGTFSLGGEITDQGINASRLVGQGYATHLQMAGSTQANCINLSAVNHVVIENLRVDGNSANQTDGGNRENQCGIRFFECNDVTVRDCWVFKTVYSNVRNQASDINAERYRVQNCYLFDTSDNASDGGVADGVSASANSGGRIDHQIHTGNYIIDCGHSFIEIADMGFGVEIANNICDSTKNAKAISVHGQDVQYCKISGNYVNVPTSDHTGIGAINVNVPSVSIVGNHVEAHGGGHGILLYAGTVASDSNVIGFNDVNSAAKDGIRSSEPDAIIVGNHVQGSGDNGIQFGGNDSIVSLNRIKGSTNAGINDASTGSVVTNNITGNPN